MNNATRAPRHIDRDLLVLGELDGGNLGNDGTFEVFLRRLRERAPTASVLVFGYGTHLLAERLDVAEEPMNAPRSHGRGILGAVDKVWSRIWDFERTRRRVAKSGAVVIAGTGLFEGDHGTSFVGWPLAFWRTAAACCLHRRPLLIIGVGASEVGERATRFLFTSGLKKADVVTYRDARSRDVVRQWLRDPGHGVVTADLVFADVVAARTPTAPYIALGVMAGGGGTAGSDARSHASEMATIARGVLDRGFDVRLITGDGVDLPILEDVATRIGEDPRVSTYTAPTLDALASELAGASAVIATRFHNVIAGLLSGRPTVALSYADKTRDLMDRVGLGAYVFDTADIDAATVLAALDQALAAGAGADEVAMTEMRDAARSDVERVAEALSMSAAVTVGIPVYNGERYLEEAIRSLQAQTLSDIEILISDNASTDSTPDICRRIAAEDPRVRYLRNDVNLGGPGNANRLVHEASAPLFKWAYADDLCGPDLLRDCVDALEALPGAVLACPRVLQIDESGKVRMVHDDAALGLDAPQPHVRLERIYDTMAEQALFGVIRTDALRRTRLVPPYLSDGYILMTELALLGPFAQTQSQEMLVRFHEGQAGANRRSQFRWIGANRRRDRVFAYTRVTGHLIDAIDRSDLPAAEKRRCRGVVYRRWTIRKWRSSASDVKNLWGDLRR